jgi:hypothetical protein
MSKWWHFIYNFNLGKRKKSDGARPGKCGDDWTLKFHWWIWKSLRLSLCEQVHCHQKPSVFPIGPHAHYSILSLSSSLYWHFFSLARLFMDYPFRIQWYLERDLWWRKFCLGELGERHFKLFVFLLRVTLWKLRLVCSVDGVNTARFTTSCFHKMFAGGVSCVFSCLAHYGAHILHRLSSYENLS